MVPCLQCVAVQWTEHPSVSLSKSQPSSWVQEKLRAAKEDAETVEQGLKKRHRQAVTEVSLPRYACHMGLQCICRSQGGQL